MMSIVPTVRVSTLSSFCTREQYPITARSDANLTIPAAKDVWWFHTVQEGTKMPRVKHKLLPNPLPMAKLQRL